ncbi:MAG: aminotransferase class V-fold PLP-dependent enzyme [Acidobacteriia bacterium]|nr:aminotransferase class V-fold PLP-dependent enzyme [Terriglobia bacterium]
MFSRRRFLRSVATVPVFLPAAKRTLQQFHFLESPQSISWAAEPDKLTPGEAAYWKKVRSDFLIPSDEAFFNTATLGSMPRSVVEAFTTSATELAATVAHWDYKPEHPDWFTGYRNYPVLMGKLAKLIHCDPDEVCTTQNATFGMNFIAQGIDLQAGDEIVQTDQEHPGGSCGWLERAKRHGAVYRKVELPSPPNDPDEIVRRFAAVINSKTRVLAVPHMTSMLGIVLPVKRLTALAREKGARHVFVALDGAQAIGHIPLDMRDLGCDAYFSSPHKWLLAPAGSGLLYIKRDRQKEIWTTLASAAWADMDKGAYRFMQYGTGNLSVLKGYEAAIDYHENLGPDRVTRRIKQLGDYLRGEIQNIKGTTILSSVHPEMCAGITTWRVEGVSGEAMVDTFWNNRKIRVRSMGGKNGVRQSTHIYNNEAEIDSMLVLARELAAQQGEVSKGE